MDTIEKHCKEIYKTVKERVPSLRHLSFEVAEYESDIGLKIGGWVHWGRHDSVCYNYTSISDLEKFIDSLDPPEKNAHNRR